MTRFILTIGLMVWATLPSVASASATCQVSSLSTLADCMNTVSVSDIVFQSDVTCTGSACCSGSNALMNMSGSSGLTIQGNGHFFHRLADPATGIGYQAQCPAMSLSGTSHITIKNLSIDDDETVPACAIGITATGGYSFNCANTIWVRNAIDTDFQSVGIYHAKGYAVSAQSVTAFKFNNGVISDAGVIGFDAGPAYGGPDSSGVAVTNSVISRTGANAIAFGGVTNSTSVNEILSNILNANHHSGAWPVGNGKFYCGGQVYLPNVNGLLMAGNVIADTLSTNCNGGDLAIELGSGQVSPTVTLNNTQIYSNYIYNGYAVYWLNSNSLFGGTSALGAYDGSKSLDRIVGYNVVADNFTSAAYDPSGGASLILDDVLSTKNPILGRLGASDYSIYRLRALVSGYHSEANSANELNELTGGSAVLEAIFGLSPNPRVGAGSTLPIYRCYVNGNSLNPDFASNDPHCGMLTERRYQSILGYTFESTYPGAMPFYSCLSTRLSNDYFVSWDPHCEGQTVVGQLGYAVPHKYLTPLATYTQGILASQNSPNTWQIPHLLYSISPALPAGLSLDANTGVISGTPAAASPSTLYTVTVNGSILNTDLASKTVSIPLRIAVRPQLSYPLASFTYAHGEPVAVSGNSPNPSSASVFTTYSVSPALPQGLALNRATGAITGTPALAAAAARYTVTGTNSEGDSSSVILTIAVN